MLRRVEFYFTTKLNKKDNNDTQEEVFVDLLSIGVLPEFRGKGVADELITLFQKSAEKAGYDYMHLGVLTENIRARKFYEKYDWYDHKKIGKCTHYRYDIKT